MENDMLDEIEFPYGQEINDVGSEHNDAYFSHVTGNAGSYKNQSSGGENNVPVSSENSLQSSLTVEAETATTVTSVEAGSTSSATTAATTASAAAGATVIAVTIGIVSVGTSLAIISHHFSYSSSMMTREIYYSMEVEAKEDKFVYVSLLDENNVEVELQEFEITLASYEKEISDPGVSESINYYPIYGTFHDLHYHTVYHLEAFYYEGEEKKVFCEEKDMQIEYIPYSIQNVEVSFYPEGEAIVAINYFFAELDKQFDVVITDKNSKEVAYQESFITNAETYVEDYGEGYYLDKQEINVEGLLSLNEYDVDIIVDNNNLYHDSFMMPEISPSIHLDDFSYESDMNNKSIHVYYYLTIEKDSTVNINLYDEKENLVASKEYELLLSDASLDGNIYYYDLNDVFTDLEYNTSYRIELFYYQGSNKINLHTDSDLMIEVNPHEFTDISYEFDASRKLVRINTDMTFQNEEESVKLQVFDVDGGVKFEQTFLTEIDENNPGYVDYGNNTYGMRFTSDIFYGFISNQEYDIKYYVNDDLLYETSFIFPESESGDLPYISLIDYSIDYDTRDITLNYIYNDNGITYAYYQMEMINLHDNESYDYYLGDSLSSTVYFSLTEAGLPIGYTYRFNLCGYDEQDNKTILTQNAIYY